METTLTMAGLSAPAGAARLRVVAPVASVIACRPTDALDATYGVTPQHQVSGSHPSATWTKGAIAKPATFMVFNLRKNRPTRPLLEHSP